MKDPIICSHDMQDINVSGPCYSSQQTRRATQTTASKTFVMMECDFSISKNRHFAYI